MKKTLKKFIKIMKNENCTRIEYDNFTGNQLILDQGKPNDDDPRSTEKNHC